MCTRRHHAGLVPLTGLTSSAHPVKTSLWLTKASWSPVVFLVPHIIWEGQQLLPRTASQGGISFAADRHELCYFSCLGCCCLRDQNNLKRNLHFLGIRVSYRTYWSLSFTTKKSSCCSHWRSLQGKTASTIACAEAKGAGTAGVMLERCWCTAGSRQTHREQDASAQLFHRPGCPPRWHVGHQLLLLC